MHSFNPSSPTIKGRKESRSFGRAVLVQATLASKPHGAKKGQVRTERPALLKGLIFTSDGRAMTPHSTKGNGGRLYRYYMSTRDSKEGHGASGVKMLPAGELEQAVMAQVRGILASPEVVTQVWREICKRKDKSTQAMTEMQAELSGKAQGLTPEMWSRFMTIQSPMIQNLMGDYVEQSKSVFMQMQDQMQKSTEQVLGAFGMKR